MGCHQKIYDARSKIRKNVMQSKSEQKLDNASINEIIYIYISFFLGFTLFFWPGESGSRRSKIFTDPGAPASTRASRCIALSGSV